MTALTVRQRQILSLAADGASRTDIAKTLRLSPQTVKTHLTNIYRKLGVKNRAAAAMAAIDSGQLNVDAPAHATPTDVRLHSSGALAVRDASPARHWREGQWLVVRAGGVHHVTQRLMDQHVASWQTLYNHHHGETA